MRVDPDELDDFAFLDTVHLLLGALVLTAAVSDAGGGSMLARFAEMSMMPRD